MSIIKKIETKIPVSTSGAIIIISIFAIVPFCFSYFVFHDIDKLLWLSYILLIIYSFLFSKKTSNKEGGKYTEFYKIYILCLKLMSISVLVYSLFYFLFINFISPSTLEKIIQENAKIYIDQGSREEIVAYHKSQDYIYHRNIILYIVGSSLPYIMINTLFAAVIAAICAKKLPEVVNEDS